jgi:KipI family sensor histidine kinase inhibitor
MTIETASVDSAILYFQESISEEVLDQVQHAYLALKNLANIIDLTPSYNSILIQYDMNYYDHLSIKEAILKQLSEHQESTAEKCHKLIEIPVDYSQGIDLKRVAEIHNISTQEVIARHTQNTYRVYAIGFMVGFAYLAKVDDAITTPRLSSPRDKVPKGSVAIADTQTAIYPQDSAGGWNIIGYTDFKDFNHFEVGDSVRFIDARL